MNRRYVRALVWLGLLLGVLAASGLVHANNSINAASLNGSATSVVTVAPGAAITASITVVTSSSAVATKWRSTGWRISTSVPGTVTCFDNTNHDSNGTSTESFSITAPATPGTYNAYFIAYDNDTCSSNGSTTKTLTGKVIVVAPLLINSVTLNGASSVAVGVGDAITAVVNVTTNSSVAGYQWRSTGWRISTSAPGSLTCVNHANHDTAGTFSETFSITAPTTYGTYDAYFIAYNDDSCGAGASATKLLASGVAVLPKVIELNSTGGTSATNGLHFYIEDSTVMQVKRLNNTGQVYDPGSIPPSAFLDNGVFLRADGLMYGSSNDVAGFIPSGGAYNSVTLTNTTPANPATSGVQQTASGTVGVTNGPQVSVVWKYTTPLEFLTAEVTLVIPPGYAVSSSNPVRYYHVFDTYLGGSDQGCGVTYVDSNGKRVVGTYPPSAGTTCPSSTAIPSGVSIVESFRERSGNFSHYCTNGWYSFWDSATSGTACAISSTTSLNDAVTTSYIDTGIGIEYDFTAAGTYTFSYDFVIGSPVVPAYDHLEIQHDGAGTLCPENVTVLACTSSTVPCPAASRVSSGTLTGALTTTPTTPAVTKTPATFSLGGSGSTATVALQGVSPGGSYTLGTSGLSTVPLNGTKCWNTTTLSQSCTLAMSNVPCVGGFECIETGVTYNNRTSTPLARNPLYTKLAGTDFKFDVVALQTDGTQASSYTAASNVTVELFDDASPAASCSAYAGAIASQSISFVAGDAGRKTLSTNVNLSNAYGKVRCRVSDANLAPAISGCSSDDFAVRPPAIKLFTTASAAPPPSVTATTNTPKVKAGASFTLYAENRANQGTNYTASLTQDSTKLTAQTTAQVATQVSGGTVGSLTPNSLGVNSATAPSNNATYSEAGYLYLAAGAYYDAASPAFTAVDSGNGDCIAGSFSDTAVSGKYGCNIGTVAASLGRFIPDHFDMAILSTLNPSTPIACPAFPMVCPANAGGANAPLASANGPISNGMVYANQPFTMQVTAKNSTGGTTQNYTGSIFAKATTLSAWSARGADPSIVSNENPSGGTLSGAAPVFTSGVAKVIGSKYGSTLPTVLSATDVYFRATETTSGDGVTSRQTTPTNSVEAGLKVASGRIKIPNAYGSERLPLPMAATVQYYNSNNQWVTSLSDSTMSFNSALSTAPTPGNLTASMVTGPANCISVNNPAIAAVMAGVRTISLAAASACSYNISLTGTPTYLPINPAIGARATFGIFKSPLIYRRENY